MIFLLTNRPILCAMNAARSEFHLLTLIKRPKITMWPNSCFPYQNGTDFTKPLETIAIPASSLEPIQPPVSDEVSLRVEPISFDRVDFFIGYNKGIQGSNNSCYIDTLLFALFACSDAMDDLVEEADPRSEARSCLLNSIVYPLRTFHFVQKEHIHYLREQISRITNNEKFLIEPRDIQETMEALFKRCLNITPPVVMGWVWENFFCTFERLLNFVLKFFKPNWFIHVYGFIRIHTCVRM